MSTPRFSCPSRTLLALTRQRENQQHHTSPFIFPCFFLCQRSYSSRKMDELDFPLFFFFFFCFRTFVRLSSNRFQMGGPEKDIDCSETSWTFHFRLQEGDGVFSGPCHCPSHWTEQAQRLRLITSERRPLLQTNRTCVCASVPAAKDQRLHLPCIFVLARLLIPSFLPLISFDLLHVEN